MKFILKLLLVAATVFFLPSIVPGIIVSSFYTAIMVAIVLSLINATLRPVLFILTLPVTILTLGLFAFILNALLLLFIASIVKGFTVTGFIPALLGSLVLSVVSTLVGHLLKH